MNVVEALKDSFGRQVHDLRISVTDRCNFRCTYCMPHEDMRWLPRSEILTFEEIERVARVFVERFGLASVRVTGGEPTARAHLPELVAQLARLPVELSMTTNGATLDRLAVPLKKAGLDRVTISCDSLRPERFAGITGRDMLPQVLAGLDAAVSAGLAPVKVNTVLVRGVNDDEVVDLARFGRERGVEVRFIEFMPLDGDGQWSLDRVVPANEVVERLDAVFPLAPVAGAKGTADGTAEGAAGKRALATRSRPGAGRSLPLPGRVRVRGRHRQRDQAFLLELRPGATDGRGVAAQLPVRRARAGPAGHPARWRDRRRPGGGHGRRRWPVSGPAMPSARSTSCAPSRSMSQIGG